MRPPWTQADLIRLKMMIRQKASAADIARSLGKRVGSVKAKIREIGLVPLKKAPEAIRRLVELGLAGAKKFAAPSQHTRAKAKKFAAEQIDRMGNSTATAEEQASRKRRLLKGPEEFREARVDRPKAKGK